MRAGNLDERLTLQARTETTVRGETSVSYADVGPVWAHVEEEAGREQVRAGRIDATRSATVLVRYADGRAAGADARFVRADGRALDVVGPPREVGRREGLEFLCTEGSD